MENRVAAFIDFENIALAVRDHFEYERVNLKAILDEIQRKANGRIVVKRAYADWGMYKDYRSDLLNNATDPIQVFALTGRGKNGADIKIAIDVMDVVLHQTDVTHVAVVSGDSDFTPLVLKLRESGRYVLGLGIEKATSNYLVKSCDMFSFYEQLRGEDGEPLVKMAMANDGGNTPAVANPLDPVALLAKALAASGNKPIPGSALKLQMRRIDPLFDEGRHGFNSFLEFLRAHESSVIDLYKPAVGDVTVGPKGSLNNVDGASPSEVANRAAEQRANERASFQQTNYVPYETTLIGTLTAGERYRIWLRDNNFRFVPSEERQQIMRVMYDIFCEAEDEGISLKEAKDRLHHWFEENRPAVPWESINSTVYHLFYTWCFSFDRTDGDDKPLWDRRTSLQNDIHSADELNAKFEKMVVRKMWEKDRNDVDIDALNEWLFDGEPAKRDHVVELLKGVEKTVTGYPIARGY